MADLNSIQASDSTKIVGADSSGVEQTPVQSTSSGGLHTNLRDSSGNDLTTSRGVKTDKTFSSGVNSRPSITSTASTILTSNSNRKYAYIMNQSGQNVYLKLGDTAVATEGILLAPLAIYEITANNLWTGSISAIKSGGGSVNIEVFEGT